MAEFVTLTALYTQMLNDFASQSWWIESYTTPTDHSTKYSIVMGSGSSSFDNFYASKYGRG